MVNGDDVDIDIWEQERGFWMPRIAAVIATNSLLFLGYVQIRQTKLGDALIILAFSANIWIYYDFRKLGNKLKRLEERIWWMIPPEFRNSSKTAKARSEYKGVIFLFLSIWFLAASLPALDFFTNGQDLKLSGIDDAFVQSTGGINPIGDEDLKDFETNGSSMYLDAYDLNWRPSKGIKISLPLLGFNNSSVFHWTEATNITDIEGHKYNGYALQIRPHNRSKFATIKLIEYIDLVGSHFPISSAYLAESLKDNYRIKIEDNVTKMYRRSFQEEKYDGILLCVTPKNQSKYRYYVAEYAFTKGNRIFAVHAIAFGDWNNEVQPILDGLRVEIS